MLLTSLLFISVKIHEVKASGTIYIRADGSIDPPNSSLVTLDTVTYTLTGSVNSNASGIVVRRDHIILDGMEYTLQGTSTPFTNGIDLSDRTNVTIRNIHIESYTKGILVLRSSNSNITDNTLRGNGIGISLQSYSNYNSIAGNTITANHGGILLRAYSSNNIVAGNTLTDNHFPSIELSFFSNYNNVTGNTIANSNEGIRLEEDSNHNRVIGNTFTNDGLMIAGAYQNVVQNNTVNGKPLVYLDDVANYTVADAGQVILINCTGIRVEGLNLSQTIIGVQLWQTHHSYISGNVVASNWIGMKLSSSNISISGNTIADNRVYGMQLTSASNVSISGNNITANSHEGIWISSSIDSSIAGNTITAHNMSGIRIDFSSHLSITSNVLVDTLCGIDLESSSSINISGNNMTSNWGGVTLSHSHNTTVLGNTLESCWTFGVYLHEASFNTIVGNNITNTINYGLFLASSSNNTIYSNNFVNNSLHTLLFTVENVNSWDSGYPGGGNYWSGYDDEDLCKGPQQNLTGRDGVWDHPYVIVTDIHDRYPLTTPFGWFPPGDVDSDRDVDIFDITQMAGVYGVKYPSTWYDRLCDLNLDGDVDIFDIVEAAGNYGESW